MAPFMLGIWTGPFPIGDMDWPLSSWGYGPVPFRLGIWTGPFPVEDTHLQKPVLSCRALKGVWRRLGVKALLVFTNILTMLYEKFAELIGLILSAIVSIFRSLLHVSRTPCPLVAYGVVTCRILSMRCMFTR